MSWFLAIILGVFLSVGLTLYIVSTILLKSNSFGDTKGEIFDFSRTGVNVLYIKN